MELTIQQLRALISEVIEPDLEEQIVDLMGEPGFDSVNGFAEAKLDNDEFDFNFVELQALARNLTAKKKGLKAKTVSEADSAVVKSAKEELESLGFTFVGRKEVKKTRGFTSSAHGTHPFAGSGGGGSGFSSDMDFDGGFTSFGGGPGAIGGGYSWNPNDPRNLKMGAKRKT